MRLLIIFSFILLMTISGLAQERVRDVQIRVIDSSQLDIRYDLLEARPGDSIYVEIESKLRGPLPILPEFIRGDLGKRITAGTNRRIVWDALANGYELNEDIRATILVKAGPPIRADQPLSSSPATVQKPAGVLTQPSESTANTEPQPDRRSDSTTVPDDRIRSRKIRYTGPAWALLSAVAPGMGNVFVQTPKPKIGLRPLLTVGCYGLIAYGLVERQKSLDEYAIYEQQKNRAASEPYYQTANSHHHNYFLMTRGAVVVAAVDVVLTFMKGLRNNRLKKGEQRSQSITVWPGIQAGQPTAVVHYSF